MLIGADPELEAWRDDVRITTSVAIGGAAYNTEWGQIGADGGALNTDHIELRPNPAATVHELLHNIARMLARAQPGVEWRAEPRNSRFSHGGHVHFGPSPGETRLHFMRKLPTALIQEVGARLACEERLFNQGSRRLRDGEEAELLLDRFSRYPFSYHNDYPVGGRWWQASTNSVEFRLLPTWLHCPKAAQVALTALWQTANHPMVALEALERSWDLRRFLRTFPPDEDQERALAALSALRGPMTRTFSPAWEEL